MTALRTALAGGVLFLLPFAILVFLLSEVLDIALALSTPIVSHFPKEDLFGRSAAVTLAWVLVFCACWGAGLLARWSYASNRSTALGSFLANLIPGYRLIQASVAELLDPDRAASVEADVVLVQFGTVRRFGFEMSRNEEDGVAIVYLPNAPDAYTGIVVTVETALVETCPVRPGKLLRSLQFYGRTPIFSDPKTSSDIGNTQSDMT